MRDRSILPMEFRPPVTLRGRHVTLEPLRLEHAGELVTAGEQSEIWEHLRYGPFATPEDMREFLGANLARQAAGSDLCFAVRLHAEGRVVGMTRYLDIQREDRAVEIGGTWYRRDLWRTAVNTEAKRLLLGHAFDTEEAHRVQIKTDLRNERSQRAIERLGARRDGVLREHVLARNGYLRSPVVYSILSDEWPWVRDRLDRFLARPGSPPGAPDGGSG